MYYDTVYEKVSCSRKQIKLCPIQQLAKPIQNKDVTLHPNLSYDVAKANTVDSLYNTIEPGDVNVPITSNPSYNVPTKPYSEDEYNYVQPNEFKRFRRYY